jgi:hypothetical protein
LFASATLFGLLSHLTFGFVWAALAIWGIAGALRRPAAGKLLRKGMLVQVLAMQVPALVCIALLYAVDLRWATTLGGPTLSPAIVVERLLALSLGWPGRDPWSPLLVILPVAMVLIAQLWRLWRRGERVWWFYATLVALPAGLLIIHPPTYLFPRYFLVIVPFMYDLLIRATDRAWANRAGRYIVLALGAAFLLGQAVLLADFLAVGRGNATAGVAYLASHTPTPAITLATDRPRRLMIELGYFEKKLTPGRSFVVVADPAQKAEWLLLEDLSIADAPERLQTPAGVWQKAAAWDCSELSGETWTLYRPLNAPADSSGP